MHQINLFIIEAVEVFSGTNIEKIINGGVNWMNDKRNRRQANQRNSKLPKIK